MPTSRNRCGDSHQLPLNRHCGQRAGNSPMTAWQKFDQASGGNDRNAAAFFGIPILQRFLGDSQKYLILAQGLRTTPGSQNQSRGRPDCQRGRPREEVRNMGIFAAFLPKRGALRACTFSNICGTKARQSVRLMISSREMVRTSTAPSHQSCWLKASGEAPAASLSAPRERASNKAEL